MIYANHAGGDFRHIVSPRKTCALVMQHWRDLDYMLCMHMASLKVVRSKKAVSTMRRACNWLIMRLNFWKKCVKPEMNMKELRW
jgi:hypothetical protein